MNKLLIIAVMAVCAAGHAYAQEAEEVKDAWQKIITVPASQTSVIEKLFNAWGAQFPGKFVDAFNKYKKTGKADRVRYYGEFADFKVAFAPKNGYIEISMEAEKEHTLTAVYWNLPNGNNLLGVSICDAGEIFNNCTLAFYEYNTAKGTLTPREGTTNKVLNQINNEEVFVILPKEGKDLKYYDYPSGTYKTIKWNGNGF